jgi:methenyltetrahydrofolate cyclohydrolase
MQKDTEVFGALSEVYKLPRITEAEKIQEALKKACEVPFNIGTKSLVVAKLAKKAAEIGNVAAISDAGVAVLLAYACVQSAALNVKINLNSIREEDYAKNMWSQMQDVMTQVANLEKTVMEIIHQKIG